MRKLGKGQSVLFCASVDIQRKILECSGKSDHDVVEVADVLKWSIEETHINTRKCCPLWATQGLIFQRQEVARTNALGQGQEQFPVEIANSMHEKEAQTIVERYDWEKSTSDERVLFNHGNDNALSRRQEQVDAIREKCGQFEIMSLNSAQLQEEQERELSPENEREQQVHRPPALDPAPHTMHRDVKNFLTSGTLNLRSDAFKPAFDTLRLTSAAPSLEGNAWPKGVLVTADFARTVEASEQHPLDLYQRPVNWVVRSSQERGLVVLSPYEANEALPLILKYKRVSLHVYSACTSGTMRPIDGLEFYAIPSIQSPIPYGSETMLLNIFAGQLYFKDFDEYVDLCRFLGLCYEPPTVNVRVLGDGFVHPSDRAQYDAIMAQECPFSKSPVPLVQELIGYRRKGLGYARSHMGAILNGERLTRETFGEPEVKVEDDNDVRDTYTFGEPEVKIEDGNDVIMLD